MRRALLDVNVLLALLDSDHVDHERAGEWLDAEFESGWASCAITENGFVRVLSQPRYPSPIPAAQAIALLDEARSGGDHSYWPCDVSTLDQATIDRERIYGHRQVTDAYLLALAVAHGGRFVTFDRSVPMSAVTGAKAEHLTVL
ncbi:MAG: TA system VapC family ribonuclease toxin [Candidatus Nanopelagicales bacterium]